MSTQIIATLAASGGKIYATDRPGTPLGQDGRKYLVLTRITSTSDYDLYISDGRFRANGYGVTIAVELAN